MGNHTRVASCSPASADDKFFEQHNHTRSPVVIQWLATLRCGLDCAHCMTADANEPMPREMPLDLALDFVEQVANLGVEELLISGGEPFERQDLPAVIARLGQLDQRYSLNTARMPSAELQRVFEKAPPSYVAVSVDGPQKVHDAFRGRSGSLDEALESIEYFSSLGVRVAAGTTVTRRNLRSLTETLGLVSRTSACSWGIHLLVPEGRAKLRRDLFPTRRQLRWLLRFIADKRAYFPVELADELGFCGDFEPLVRDLPMSCGAGKTQCVILPSGDVVPCTTLDLKTSAGNLHERPLADIWRHGFADLRRNRPKGRCRSCEYFSACGGGCWLQRRNDSGCFRDVWGGEQLVATAASLAVAVGLSTSMACSARRQSPTTTDEAAVVDAANDTLAASQSDQWHEYDQLSCREPSQPASWQDVPDGSAGPIYSVPVPRSRPYAVGTSLDAAVLFWTLNEAHNTSFDVDQLPEEQRQDPAWTYYQALVDGALPATLEGRSQAIRDALCTQERSLGFSATLWRSFSEVLLDGPDPIQRSPSDRAHVRDALLNLATISGQWRRDIFDRRLDPYLARGRRHRAWAAGWRLKSGPPRPSPWFAFMLDVAEERWGPQRPRREGADRPGGDELTMSDEDRAVVEAWLGQHPLAEGLQLILTSSQTGPTIVGPSEQRPVEQETSFGIFDLLTVAPGSGPAQLQVTCEGLAQPLSITVPENVQLAYVDLLRLIYAQHRAAIDAMAEQIVSSASHRLSEPTAPIVLPAVRARHDSNPAKLWLADFWLF